MDRIRVWVQKFQDRPNLMLQWTDPATGKRRSKSAGTADADEAEIARADLESDLNNGRHREASRLSWERFRAMFEDEFVAGRRPKTRQNYADSLNLFERLAAPSSLRGVNERTLSGYVAAMRREPGRGGNATMAASTIRVHLQYLRAALRWAVAQKLLPEAPVVPTVRVSRRRPQSVPAEQAERLFALADDHLRAFLLCAWLAGLRLAEAIELEREPTDRAPWIDSDRRRVVFPAGFVKGDEDQWVPLDPKLAIALDALPRHGVKVFDFGRASQQQSIGRRVVALARRAGVKLTMKSLRRGFGCNYAARVPAQVLQKLMRHANIKTTMEYYANVDDAVEAAVRSFSEARDCQSLGAA